MKNKWVDYYKKTKDKPPRPSLVEALKIVRDKEEALDLGSGALNDTRYLVSAGFKHVTSVDKNSATEEVINNLPDEKVSYVVSAFDNFEFPENKYDLINAQYSLPFNPPESFNKVFDKVFDKVVKSLKEGGVLVGQFFGINDEWSTNESMTFQTREEVGVLLSGLKIVSLKEEEMDGKTATGGEKLKHWHIFHFIAYK